MSGPTPQRLAIVATHPIQHFVPLYRSLSQEPGLAVHVFFGSRIGLEPYFDSEMNTEIRWNMDLTSGYAHTFLPEAVDIKAVRFWTMNNPSVGPALGAFRPHAVIVYGYSNLTALRAIAWGRLHSVPILMISDSENVHVRPTAKRFLKFLVLRILAMNVSAFLTVGDNNERYWASYGVRHARMFRTPYTIDEEEYVRVRSNRVNIRRAWRRDNGIDDGDVVFLAVGKLSPRKRHRDLIEALAVAVTKTRTPTRIVLAGDGPERPALEATANSYRVPVTFLGFVNLDELPKAVASADVLVHPSNRDPHPLVLSEAACMGLPIIASDHVGAVGPTDIARRGENARVYRAGDVKELADVIGDLADSPSKRDEMAVASLRIFRSQNRTASVQGVLNALRFVSK